ncbi:MAG: fimbrillin family protein [Muribaculaceae bacterium]
MKLHNLIIVFSIILLLQSCNKIEELSGDDVPGYSPIFLTAKTTDTNTRAYIPTGMYDNFKVYAVSETGSTQKPVMEGYEVKYVTDSWTYVNDLQDLMFWDYNADRYLFTAGAPIEAVNTITTAKMQLHLKNNTSRSVMAAEPVKIERSAPEFGKIVNLRFGYAHCSVRVAIVKNSSEQSNVSDIKLTPDAAITTEADLTYTYNWSTSIPTATTNVASTAISSESLSFDNVTIAAGTADAVLSSTRYYCVPDATNTTGWTVSLKCDDEVKSGTFVNEQTWESGKNYIYIFSLEAKTPKLIYVVSGDMEYFDCNDIVPGGDFSDSDMTE